MLDRAASLRTLTDADTRRGTHRHDAGLKTSRPSAFAHADTRRTSRRAADRAPLRPRPPPRAEENFTPHLLVWERDTPRVTLEVLATWAPATAMLPLPLASNSTISHCPRRDEAPVPPLLPTLVVLLLPPQRCALPL